MSRSGPPPPATRARKNLTRDDVVSAAARMARRDGLEKLTIRGLCDELGVTSPTIYWHVNSKDALIALLVDRVFERVRLPDPDEGDWLARLRAHTLSVHDEVAPYPGMASAIARDLPTPNGVRVARESLGLLQEAGFATGVALSMWSTLTVFVTGHLLYAERFLSLGRTDDAPPTLRALPVILEQRTSALDAYEDVDGFRELMQGLDGSGSRRLFAQGLDRLLVGFRAELDQTGG